MRKCKSGVGLKGGGAPLPLRAAGGEEEGWMRVWVCRECNEGERV